ncbi:MAG: regulatory protein RecX [Thermovirgaceae bacterium]
MTEGFEKALGEAMRILARREYTKWELRCKLTKKGYSEDVVKEVLDETERAGYVDDGEYARRFQETREEWGYRRVKYELARRGIEEGVLEKTLAYDEETEYERAMNLVRSWMPGLTERQLAGRLMRRGFREGLVRRLVRKACGESS